MLRKITVSDLTGEGIAPQGTTFNWNFGPSASPSNANTQIQQILHLMK